MTACLLAWWSVARPFVGSATWVVGWKAALMIPTIYAGELYAVRYPMRNAATHVAHLRALRHRYVRIPVGLARDRRRDRSVR